jgi:hypothetical protein
MPYSDKDLKVTNVNYLNKDFNTLKSALMEYAKTYFPNTYRDFNETSPGMMLIEMGAYVGDVLSFYIDQQYKEMMLPLAEERKNVINLAKTLGYRVKPTTPAYVDLTVSQVVDAVDGLSKLKVPDWNQAFTIQKDMQIQSTADSNTKFETLDIIDFTVSESIGLNYEVDTTNSSTGLAETYKLTRRMRAISGEKKEKVFNIGSPSKFLKLTLPEKNVVEIVDIKDANGNKYYEVEYLAQDKVPKETHYTDDTNRDTAYIQTNNDGSTTVTNIPIPYTLEYIRATKRFTTEVNDNNTTSIIFGNGLLRTGTTGSLSDGFSSTENAGLTIPGDTTNYNKSISPWVGTSFSSLGETPANTNLTVTYRIGGGISANVAAGELTTINSKVVLPTGADSGRQLSVTNIFPARGGSSGETIEEIRRRAMAHFTTQNRCVTKEDFEARVMSMPAKFGGIAKVYCDRSAVEPNHAENLKNNIQLLADTGALNIENINSYIDNFSQIGDITNLPSVKIYILSYDQNKNLVQAPDLLKSNLKNYLNQYRMITDEIDIQGGYIINFGVAFDVIAHRASNKADVKLRCINKITEYFNINKMHFHQPIQTNDLEYILMGLDGVRAVNYVELTQQSTSDSAQIFDTKIWGVSNTPENITSNGPSSGYGWEYNFNQFYNITATAGPGFVLPSMSPAVFELKNPSKNVKGIVR